MTVKGDPNTLEGIKNFSSGSVSFAIVLVILTHKSIKGKRQDNFE